MAPKRSGKGALSAADRVRDLDDRFADNLRAIRTDKGVSRTRLAARTGIPVYSIEKIETGSGCRDKLRRRVTIGEAIVLAEALGVKPGELLSAREAAR